MVKISLDDVKKGINKSNVYGKHKNKFKNYTNPKPKMSKQVKDPENRLNGKISNNEEAILEYRAETANQRGFKDVKTGYLGHKPLWWSKDKFTPNRTGFRDDSGASRGGYFTTKKGKRGDQVFGVAGKGNKDSSRPMGEPNPFPVRPAKNIVKSIKKNVKKN